MHRCRASLGNMTQDADHNAPGAEEVEARQVEDAPLRRSEEEAERTNPEVHHEPGDDSVEEEEVESFRKWEQDQTN